MQDFSLIPQHALNPRHDFVRRWVRGLVEVDDTRANVRLDVSRQRRASLGNGRVMRSAYKHCVEVSWAARSYRKSSRLHSL